MVITLNKTRGNSRLTHMTNIGNKSHKAPSLSQIRWEEAEISTGRVSASACACACACACASAHQWYYLGDPPPEVARGGSTNIHSKIWKSVTISMSKNIYSRFDSDISLQQDI